jgi:hypothetical protein
MSILYLFLYPKIDINYTQSKHCELGLSACLGLRLDLRCNLKNKR